MNEERIAKYQAWQTEIESRQRLLAGKRRGYFRFFLLMFLGSGLGFVVNHWVGIATVFSGALFSIFGYYVISVREGDYIRELEHTRRELKKLRHDARFAAVEARPA